MRQRSGGCSCGAVRYRVVGEPLRVGICHCTSCRKESGSVFTAFAVWPESAFETTGETLEWERRRFCPKCGSPLYATAFGDPTAMLNIRAGVIRQRDRLVPKRQVWGRSRQSWVDNLLSIARLEKQSA